MQTSNVRNLTLAGITFSIALALATCDLDSARDLARVVFLEPEPGLSRQNYQRPEGVFIKPEGIPFSRERR